MRHKIVLSSFIFALLSPAPAALAQSECGVQTGDTVICDPQDYPGGITYDSLGDLTLEVPNASVDLRLLDDGASVTGIGGDNIAWDSSAFVSGEIVGDADVDTFDGAVLDYLSDTGNIDILVGGVIIGRDSASHAIRAESTGGGAVSVTTEGDIQGRFGTGAPGTGIEALTTTGDITIDAQARVNAGRNGGQYAIHAGSSAGGNIDIGIAAGESFAVLGGGTGTTHGILAETTGAGNITVSSDGGVSVFSATVSGIEAVTDSGHIDIAVGDEVRSGASGVIAETGGAGTIILDLGEAQGRDADADGAENAIRAIADSGDITITAGRVQQRAGTAVVTHTDGLATINLTGNIEGDVMRFSFSGPGADTAISSTGGSVVVNVSGTPTDRLDGSALSLISAPFDFGGLSGNAEINLNAGGGWIVTTTGSAGDTGSSVFSAGDDVVNVGADAYLLTPMLGGSRRLQGFGRPQTVDEARYTADFGAGANVVNNAGDVIVAFGRDTNRDEFPGELRLDGLAEFNNTGTLWLGATNLGTAASTGTFARKTDHWPDDILAIPGASFHGGPGSRVEMDMDLNQVDQDRCNADARTPRVKSFGSIDLELGDLAADCINIEGGAATGRTELFIRQMIPGDRGAFNPDGIVLVDLTGGDPADTDPDAFVIAPDSEQYVPVAGGIIDKGLFFFTVAFDPEVQQFRLYGFPSSGAQQGTLLAQAANQLWRTSTGAWFDRRVDQRDIDRDDRGGSFWFRTTRGDSERDVITPIQAGGEVLDFDNSFTQDDSTATIGTDFIARSAGNSAWVIGGMLGYGRSDIAFDASPNSAELRGMHAGLYGSFVLDAFFVDVAVNRTWLDVDFDVPAMRLQPETALVRGELESTGAQIEAGWRLNMGRFSVEPLVGYSHVTADVEDIFIPADDPLRFGGEISYDDPTSSRGSLGVRLRMDDVAPGIVPVSVGLTAKAIEEFDGESTISIANIGPQDAPMANTFDGTFGQVTGDVSVTNETKTLAGFLKVDGMFHDDYESVGVSVGFRAQW